MVRVELLYSTVDEVVVALRIEASELLNIVGWWPQPGGIEFFGSLAGSFPRSRHSRHVAFVDIFQRKVYKRALRLRRCALRALEYVLDFTLRNNLIVLVAE